MQNSKGNLQPRQQQIEKQIEFDQYKIFNEIKNAQHVEINQYQTIMAVLASNLKLSIYDAITRNQLTEINIQDYVKIENSIKQSAYYKCGDVIMRFLKNSNYLGVYLKNYGDFLIIRISEPKNTKPIYRLQLQEKLSFIEMDPFSKNFFIFGQKSIEYGNIKTLKNVFIEEGQSIEVQIVNSNDNLEEDFQSDQTESEDGDTKFPKSVSSQMHYNKNRLNAEDSVKEDDNQVDGQLEQGSKIDMVGIKNSKANNMNQQQKIKQRGGQDMEQESEEDYFQQQENEDNEGEDEDKSENADEEDEEEMEDIHNLYGQIIPEEENIVEGNRKISKKGNLSTNNNNRNNLNYKKSSNRGNQQFKSKANDRNNLTLQSGTNISINNSTHNNNNNDRINGEVETKLLDSNSYAVFLKQRCSKTKKTILGFVNRQIVIYEIKLSEEKEVSFSLLNRLELNELHEYDMQFVQMCTNIQNDKFALVLDKKFMHLFDINSEKQICTYPEEYLSQDQTKRYMNPMFWRDPFDKEKPEYFVYLDNTHLNCSLCFLNLKTSKRQIVILQADKPRNFVQNMRWEGCVGVIGEGGSIFILECPRQYYWENFSYRFKGLEKNQQYIEREDEFDFKDEENEKKPLTGDEFDNLKTHYADFIYPLQHKIFKDAIFDERDDND
ncbi:hypothetical protein ABPG72_004232 [Tetrahymena utriculariae]